MNISFLNVIVKCIFFVLGGFCVYLAFFSFESEQIKIQNTIEEWWVKLDDNKKITEIKLINYLRRISLLTTLFINKLFGEKNISFRALWVSFFYLNAFVNISFCFSPLVQIINIPIYFMILICLILVILTILPLFIDFNHWIKWGLLFSVASLMLFIIYRVATMPGEMIQIDEWVFEPFDMLSVNLILYFICTISCMLLVAFFRWSIKSCSDFNSIKKIVLIISILFLFAICLILLPLIIGGINPQRHPSEYFNVLTFSDFASLLPLLISIVNVGSIFPLLLFLVLLITIPANKLVWELLNRGLYNLAHVKTIANKGILITMASALFALGFKFTMLYPGLNTHEVLIDNHSSVNVEYLSKDTIKYLNSHSEILKDTVIEYENSIIDTLKINYIENCTKVLCTGWLETGGNKTYIWFEWGTTPEFENATKKWIFINDSQFGCWVKNLHENTVYFFRTAKMDGLGTHYTKTSLFKTAICK